MKQEYDLAGGGVWSTHKTRAVEAEILHELQRRHDRDDAAPAGVREGRFMTADDANRRDEDGDRQVGGGGAHCVGLDNVCSPAEDVAIGDATRGRRGGHSFIRAGDSCGS